MFKYTSLLIVNLLLKYQVPCTSEAKTKVKKHKLLLHLYSHRKIRRKKEGKKPRFPKYKIDFILRVCSYRREVPPAISS